MEREYTDVFLSEVTAIAELQGHDLAPDDAHKLAATLDAKLTNRWDTRHANQVNRDWISPQVEKYFTAKAKAEADKIARAKSAATAGIDPKLFDSLSPANRISLYRQHMSALAAAGEAEAQPKAPPQKPTKRRPDADAARRHGLLLQAQSPLSSTRVAAQQELARMDREASK